MENHKNLPPEDTSPHRNHLAVIFAVSTLLTAFNIFIIIHRMPFDGDSYEYASLARGLPRHGELRENVVRMYNAFPEPPLPHPAAQRAGLYPFILAPFVAAFGNSPWAFIIPFQIFFFLFPFAAYRAGAHYFPPRISLLAALTAAAHPRILFFAGMEDPGQPEMLLCLCLLAALACAARSRFFLTGLLVSTGILLKQTAFLFFPPLALWILLCGGRRHVALAHLALGALLAISPLLVRNAVVFGNPVHSEHFKAVGSVDFRDFREGNLFKAIFSLPPEQSDMSMRTPRPKTGEILKLRIEKLLIGNYITIGWFPGVAALLFAPALPFFLIGLASARGRPERLLLILIILATLIFFIASPVWYLDRYIHFLLPILFLFAYAGIESLGSVWKGFSASRLFAFVCAAELLPVIVVYLFMAAGPGENFRRVTYRELVATCAWVRENTPPDATLVTVPFWSPQFFCERKTAPLPYGNIADFAKVAKRYEADYFLFANYFNVPAPEIPFLQKTTEGKIVSLYSIDRGHPAFKNPAILSPQIKKYNFLKTLFANVPKRNLTPTLFGAMETLVPPLALRIVIVSAALFSFLGLFYFERSKVIYALILIMFFVLATIPRVHYMMSIPKPDVSSVKMAAARPVTSIFQCR